MKKSWAVEPVNETYNVAHAPVHLLSRFGNVGPPLVLQQHPRLVLGGHVVHAAALLTQEAGHPSCCLVPHVNTFPTQLPNSGNKRGGRRSERGGRRSERGGRRGERGGRRGEAIKE